MTSFRSFSPPVQRASQKVSFTDIDTFAPTSRPSLERSTNTRGFARPFQPIRILDLLPLSHLFGQSLGLFIPVLLGGSAVFTQELRPRAIIETLRRERVSVFGQCPSTPQEPAPPNRAATPIRLRKRAGGATARSTATSAGSSGLS